MSNPSANILKSSKILPIRFYSDIFQQDRFNKFHDRRLETQLSYPGNELPSFQITRPNSVNAVDVFIAKKVCNEDEALYKSIPIKASNFKLQGATAFFGAFPRGAPGIYDDGINPPSGILNSPVAEINDCNVLKQADRADYPDYTITPGATPFAELNVPGVNGRPYTLKLIVEDFKNNSSTFSIKIYNGLVSDTLIQTISAAGIYLIPITLATTDGVTISFHDYQDGDTFEISYIQMQTDPLEVLNIGDCVLNEADIQIYEKADGNDILLWCDSNQSNIIDEGDYYYVVVCGDEVYYSEVFTVRKLKELQKYYKLAWRNDTDLFNEVIYNEAWTVCVFTNVLYLDAALFKPEYGTAAENEVDGYKNNLPVFKKWEKFISLEIAKAPEFLADCLSSIFLHDTITITEPLNRHQEIQNELEVSEVTSNIEPVLLDAFQKVILRFLTTGYLVKTGCADSVELSTS